MDQTREKVVAWLRWVIEETGIPPTRLANQIGVSPSTLTRPLNEPGYKSVLKTDTIAKICAFTGLPGPDGIGAAAVAPRHGGFAERELEPYDAAQGRGGLKAKSSNQDIWLVQTDLLIMEGLVPGDQVLVDQAAMPVRGDIVVAQVYSDNRGSAETVLRRYDPPYLVAAPARRGPAPLLVDGDRVKIRGVVVEKWGPRFSDKIAS